jgi:hypothetical protein
MFLTFKFSDIKKVFIKTILGEKTKIKSISELELARHDPCNAYWVMPGPRSNPAGRHARPIPLLGHA